MNKIKLVCKQTTSPETLEILSHDNNYTIRWRVALNPNTSIETLERLSEDSDYYVRMAVINNNNIPTYLKMYLRYTLL